MPIKRVLLGRPLGTHEEEHQRLRKTIALPVFASDAISSTAYATDEIVVVLLLHAGFGTAAFGPLVPIAVIVCIVLPRPISSASRAAFCANSHAIPSY